MTRWFKRSSWIRRFQRDPLLTIAHTIYNLRQRRLRLRLPQPHPKSPLTVVCISDTHNERIPLPSGDLLIHAGDLTYKGTLAELQQQLSWLDDQPFKHKVVIGGNHDDLLDHRQDRDADAATRRASLEWGSITYLQQSTARLRFDNGRELYVHGAPGTYRYNRGAFRYSDEEFYWKNTVPRGTDVLVTHLPPRYHLDLPGRGAQVLLDELFEIRPLLHVCGHIHRSRGVNVLRYDEFEELYLRTAQGLGGMRTVAGLLRKVFWQDSGKDGGGAETILVNASIMCGDRNGALNKPIVIKL